MSLLVVRALLKHQSIASTQVSLETLDNLHYQLEARNLYIEWRLPKKVRDTNALLDSLAGMVQSANDVALPLAS